MKNTFKDIDYLYSSSRLRCLERKLLTRERMERMCEAKTNDDAVKVLEECNYPEFSPQSLADVENILALERQKTFKLLESISPDKRLVDIFKIKYDYHNLKVIIKGEQANEDYTFLLSPCGRFPANQLIEMLRENSFAGMPPILSRAVREGKEVLGRTGDPQAGDFILDKACYTEMLGLAKEFNRPFVLGYVQLLIDCINLRSAVRARRMGRGPDFLKQSLIPGGKFPLTRFMGDISGDYLESLYHSTPLEQAAEAGAAALRNEGSLAQIDLQCDNAINAYLKDAKYIAFGEQPLIAYAAAKEAELTAVRTIMAGRFGDLPSKTIKERLREAYV